jgi:hypothetical protein
MLLHDSLPARRADVRSSAELDALKLFCESQKACSKFLEKPQPTRQIGRDFVGNIALQEFVFWVLLEKRIRQIFSGFPQPIHRPRSHFFDTPRVSGNPKEVKIKIRNQTPVLAGRERKNGATSVIGERRLVRFEEFLNRASVVVHSSESV